MHAVRGPDAALADLEEVAAGAEEREGLGDEVVRQAVRRRPSMAELRPLVFGV